MKLKFLLAKYPFLDLIHFLYKLILNINFNSLSYLKYLRSLKKSNTACIVACGSSSLQLTKKDWEIIESKTDLIGLSYSIHLKKKFTYYMMEGLTKEDDEIKDYWIKELLVPLTKALKDKIIGHLIIRNYGSLEYFEKCESKKVINTIHIHSKFVTQLITKLNLEKVFLKFGILPTITGSISSILILLKLIGYKKIILLGVDLDNKGYFFSHHKWEGSKLTDTLLIQKNSLKISSLNHLTNNKNFCSFTVSEFINYFYVSNKKKIELYTAFRGKPIGVDLPNYFENLSNE